MFLSPVTRPEKDRNWTFKHYASHSSSASKLGSLNSFGLPPNTASLSNSDASGTLAGKFLTNSCNILIKLLEISPETGWDIKEIVLPCTLVVEAVELASGPDRTSKLEESL